ncbi:MAG: GumC family protein [Gammaproteobacteria bacterium]
MEYLPPHIDIIDDSPFQPPPSPKPSPWFRTRRLVIFVAAYVACATVGLIYNYSRPAVYRSSATLLTSAKTAVDIASAEPDKQHVAIQRQILLGQELLEESLQRLRISHPQLKIGMAEIRQMLTVKPVAETNLVEMQAEGPDPDALPALINTWIDVYKDAREADIAKNKGDTEAQLQSELNDLEQKIANARESLNRFREQHDIVSTERTENTATARLNGLTAALNNATEEEVKAKARLDAVKKAIERGQAVVPTQDQRSLANLEKRLQELREKLAELDQRYTREYMALQPSLKYIPREIKKLEREIEQKRSYGKDIVLTDAEQNYDAAKQAVIDVRQQLEEHKRQAAEFSASFAEHEALQSDLEGLELIYRQTQERLVQIETKSVDKYPQVNIIDRAYLPLEPFAPEYTRDSLIILAGSVAFALFCVWISEFLTRRQEAQPGLTLSGIHMYKDIGLDRLGHAQQESAHLPQAPNKILASPSLRELADSELQALLAATGNSGKQLIGLLLSGLTLEEAAALTADAIDLDNKILWIPGADARPMAIEAPLLALFTLSAKLPAWYSQNPLSASDLAAIASMAAIDSGLPHPEEINAEAIRHTYIVYLVRQGLRLSDLPQIVGAMPPAALLSYGTYSPPRPGLGPEQIDRIHPALAAAFRDSAST